MLWLTIKIIHRIQRKNKVIFVVADNCKNCGKCVKACRHNVLELKRYEHFRLEIKNLDKCTACGDCLRVCKFNALEIIEK